MTPEALSPGVVVLLVCGGVLVVWALLVRVTHRAPRTAPGRHRAGRPPQDPPGAGLHRATGAGEFLADIPAQRGGEER